MKTEQKDPHCPRCVVLFLIVLALMVVGGPSGGRAAAPILYVSYEIFKHGAAKAGSYVPLASESFDLPFGDVWDVIVDINSARLANKDTTVLWGNNKFGGYILTVSYDTPMETSHFSGVPRTAEITGRLLRYPIHERSPDVCCQGIPFHLVIPVNRTVTVGNYLIDEVSGEEYLLLKIKAEMKN